MTESVTYIVKLYEPNGAEILREWHAAATDPIEKVVTECGRALAPDPDFLHGVRLRIRREGEPWAGQVYRLRSTLELEVEEWF